MIELHIHNEINRVRGSHGLCSLAYSEQLERIAKEHSQKMMFAKTLSHDLGGISFQKRIQDGGYRDGAGENILQTNAASGLNAYNIVNSWMNSPGHRDNVLNDVYSEEGFGISSDWQMLYYVTEILGCGKSHKKNINKYLAAPNYITKRPSIRNVEKLDILDLLV
jgi:uncharacterized protein YkwD